MDQVHDVIRRFSDFTSLYNELMDKYPACLLPPLPEKSLNDKVAVDQSSFVEKRKEGLVRFLQDLGKHP